MHAREDLTFPAGAEHCASWWYPPRGATAPAPVVVMAHGLSGTRRDRLGAFAERFADAGCGALLFDHRGFGESGGERDLFVPARQLADWHAAIAFARSRGQADPERIVTFGSSMGGGNALAAAAADLRIAAVISQVPFLDIRTQAYRAATSVRLRMLLVAARGGHLPAVGRPDEPAFINAPDSERGWRRVVATGEDSRWRNRASARWLLGPAFRPIRSADGLHCPWLVCVGGADRVAAPGPAIRAARSAPHGELRIYPGVDHFDIYDGPAHEALVTDQLDFLHRHLGTTGLR
ncbi:alpha/beta hydrolase [Nocardia asteroides]|uniref:alpha/beta hydrolase n=1 Tax=Nocardia asteroides TaxID=1824 RepID=UPI001E4D3322|nr:alpha/beta fold hydrolase [Nocardia asteroides]UGT61215.1 alpha/beta hydrolase [Nocardia asteroides]